jgi:tRNA A-37 threonylcarbamoyl transferase component Bud32
MPAEKTSASLDDSEEARALLQSRLALFWKVLCALMLFASVLGAVGAMKKPGGDLIVDLVLAAEAGSLWWLCRRGRPSRRFLRNAELIGLLGYFSVASLLGRYVLVGFARERALGTSEGMLMADAYLSILGMVGSALMITARAALIPSSPRRTAIYTTLVGVPAVVTPTLLAPAAGGGFTLRALDSAAFPWFPMALVLVWSFVVFTSTVVSRAIYGLRAAVRDACRLGQYVLEEKIGQGGMGEVYRARHGMMRRPSALKLLRAERAEQRNLARFEREVQLTARLTHPNTITIFDYGRTDDGVFYYAMELLDGATLQRVVEVSGPQAEGRVVRILTMACGALSEAHASGLIHRDIKPANIMLCTQGGERDVVKLLDFGLVKELAVDGDAGLSVAATLVGTPQYMAPESILTPASVDARADIYALGAVAYFLLTGGVVFAGSTIVEVCSQHLTQEPAPMAERGVEVSTELERLVRACLAKRPEDRPQSAAELRHELEACVVDAWDAELAQRWWTERQPALQNDASQSFGSHRTIGIDARSRSELLAAG